jgi:16S rRNA (cytosine1402-N4)-methyltransferase
MAGHRPVLLDEVVDLLNMKPGGRFVDATLGLGGHAEAILRKAGPKTKLLGLDVDPDNLQKAQDRLQPLGDETITRQVNFRGLQEVLAKEGWDEVDGVLADLGVSSPQLDSPEKGFSFLREGPLDMRLDPRSPRTALSVLRTVDPETLADQFVRFGEFRGARKIARRLVEAAARGEIKTTGDLTRQIGGRRREGGGTHPATRIFLALRDLVNDELGALTDFLRSAPACLKVGGRLAIVSFHSGEDRLVKNAFKDAAQAEGPKKFQIVTKKPVVPSEDEMRSNPRSRSAKLRVLERVG